MKRQPLISVIMSVFNEEQYIEEALQSILNQTHQNFEIIIVDDCSSDNTVEIINRLSDNRIHLYLNTENRGLTRNLNRGMQMAKGKFIARMDGDDISLPKRFETQLRYFETHPDVFLISCQTETFGAENLTWKLEDNPDKLKIMMLVRPVLAHPGYMMRRELLDMGYQYDESFRSAQDYEFAARVTRQYRIGIASPVLLKYRAHDGQVSNKAGGLQFQNADRVRRYLFGELGVDLSEQEWEQYHNFVLEVKTDYIEYFLAVKKILKKVIDANGREQIYNERLLKRTLLEEFYTWVLRNKSLKLYKSIYQICDGKITDFIVFLSAFFSIIKRKM